MAPRLQEDQRDKAEHDEAEEDDEMRHDDVAII
jgi:hypothetical protein